MGKTDDNRERVNELAKQLSLDNDGEFDPSFVEDNKLKAYHMLCCNNGNAMHLTPNREPSELYKLLLKFTQGNVRDAILLKSIIYTSHWIDKHGDWMWESGQEPSFEDVLKEHGLDSSQTYAIIPSGKTISNISSDEIALLNSELIALSAFKLSGTTMMDTDWYGFPDSANRINSTLRIKLDELVNKELDAIDFDLQADELISKNSSLASVKDTIKEELKVSKRRLLERLYAQLVLLELSEAAARTLSDYWKIDIVDNDGTLKAAPNPHSMPSENNYTDNYWIYEYQSRVINFLLHPNIANGNFKLKYAAIMQLLLNDTPHNVGVAMLNAYLDIFKDTLIMRDLLINSGLLKENSRGEYTKNSIDNAFALFKREVTNGSERYFKSHKGVFKEQKQKLKSWLSSLSNGFGKLISTYGDIANGWIMGFAAAGISTTFFSSGLYVAILVGAAVKFAAHHSVSAIRENVQSNFKSYVAYQHAIKQILLGQCAYIDFFDDTDGLSIIERASLKDNDQVYNTLSSMQHDGMFVSLAKLRRSLISQIKSMESVADKDITNTAQLAKFKELLLLCDMAIKSPISDRESSVSQFIVKYVNEAEESIINSINKLNKWKNDIANEGINAVDIHELMRIKTEVIGAFDSQLSLNILIYYKHYPYLKFLNTVEEPFIRDLQQFVNDKLSVVRHTFNLVLDDYLNLYIREVMTETAARTVDGKHAKRFETNLKHWLKSEIGNGRLGMLDKYVLPSKTSTSPIIRLVSQKLEEIEKATIEEAEPLLAELETIRTKNRDFWTERMWFTNSLNKYAETDDDGKFTGYFASDVKRGVYYKQYKAERDFLIDKYNLTKEADGSINWDKYEELTYIDFLKDLIMWQGGAVRNKFGEYLMPDDAIPRVHRRFNWQYYATKVEYLGRYGTERLSVLNASIARIQEKCIEKIKVNGEEKRIPIISKLPLLVQNELRSLQIEKQLLSTPYRIVYSDDYKYIIGIEEVQSETQRELSKRFLKWNLYKQAHQQRNNSGIYTKYLAVLDWFQERIDDPKISQQEKSAIELELANFKKLNTKQEFHPEIKHMVGFDIDLFKDIDIDSDLDSVITENINTLFSVIKQYIDSGNSTRTPDLARIGDPRISNNVKSMWRRLVSLSQKLLQSSHDDLGSAVFDQRTRLARSILLLFDQLIPALDNTGEETNETFLHKLHTLFGLSARDTHYLLNSIDGTDEAPFPVVQHLLKRIGLNEKLVKIIRDSEGNPVFKSKQDMYVLVPTGLFTENTSDLEDEEYDDSNPDFILINKNRKEYNNTELFEKLQKDKYYNKMLEVMDKAWKNYEGYSRTSRYLMPQRQQSKESSFGRSFSLGVKNIIPNLKQALGYTKNEWNGFNSRDEFVQDVLTRADGTVVEQIPSRWISMLEDTNTIDTDLVSSVADFYIESARHKYRRQISPIMEAFYFKLTGAFDGKSSDALTSDLADLLRAELNKRLYGRNIIGSGENGRLTLDEQKMAKRAQIIRSVLHKRLMSHNWLSVLKNGYDSFCNLLSATFTGKYIRVCNFINAIKKLFWDDENSNVSFLTLIFGINRSKATNMTLALMHLSGIGNNIHERYSKQNQYWIHRFLTNKVASLEFESIDYTSKAIVTEAVYDSYRYMYNPITGGYEFMNESEAESAYAARTSRLAGWEAWRNSDIKLRDMYTFDKQLGVAKLKEGETFKHHNVDIDILDAVRPMSKLGITSDKRSRVLETKVMTTIRQMSSTINGMLAQEDKTMIARHYVGALATAFRGWMISQSGEFYKTGVDFYDYETDSDLGGFIREQFNSSTVVKTSNQMRQGGLDDKDFEGMYNWATGTIDVGLHKKLYRTVLCHMGALVLMMIPIGELINTSKFRHLKHMSVHEYHQLRNFAAALDFFILTLTLTCTAFASYSGGDDGDDEEEEEYNETYTEDDNDSTPRNYKQALKSLSWVAMLASISERFPQLGGGSFILGASDIIKGVTVASVLMDDAKQYLNCAKQLIGMIDPFDEEDETNKVLINGSFKGKTVGQKAITYGLADVGIDVLPYALMLDAYDKWNNQTDGQNLWSDYVLNYYKSTTEQGNLGRAKWYGENILPTLWFYKYWNTNKLFGTQLGPAPKSKVKKDDEETFEDSYNSDFNYDFDMDFDYNF